MKDYKIDGKSVSRTTYWRNKSVSNETVKDETPTNETLENETLETLETKIPVKEGICHGCGKEVNKLICICYDCIHDKKITHSKLGLNRFDYNSQK